jgi:hypothetical protein
MTSSIRQVSTPDTLNGHRKTTRGIYSPGPGMIKKMLEGHVPGAPKAIQGHSGTLQRLALAQKLKRAVLLAGPTSSAKSLLVRTFAHRQEMPLIQVQVNEDTTEAKLTGYVSTQNFLLDLGTSAEGSRLENMRANIFVPGPVALAAMADIPVVLFIDELHKMRKGVTSIVHPITNKDERMLPLDNFIGETARLHPETVVICALNNAASYGAGFERLDPALRRRFVTMYMPLTTDVDEFTQVVEANLGNASQESGKIPLPEAGASGNYDEVKGNLISAVCAFNGMKEQHMRARAGEVGEALTLDDGIGEAAIEGIIEQISPDSVISALEFIREGVDVRTAVTECIINTVVGQFDSAVAALVSFFEGKNVFGGSGTSGQP